ncbi:MAG: right-handed parallel beta-helix repeat-containing protein [Gammaproteobacteria bacterium]|nr:right-handed parallel beta-helix repeat-containing protein [Gammaproteobacteria bacterium]NNL50025.1 DUF1565 domain-containing protein [Woeseiaceae bacterium]
MSPPSVAAHDAIATEIPKTKFTNYVIPENSLFVDVTGDDSNRGSAAMPLRTLERAISVAVEGTTIVLRQGTYREGDLFVSKRLTFQPYPGETVWLTGSVLVDDWIEAGDRWRKDEWDVQFDNETYDKRALTTSHPLAGHPDMVFVDDLPLRQVGSLDEVIAGTFFVDYRERKLYIGDSPQGRRVEASVFKRGLRVQADQTVIRGIGFMRYASHRYAGALQIESSNHVIVENNTFAWSASTGLTMIIGDGALIRGNTFLNNGRNGLGAWRYDNVVVENNRFAGNNQERFILHGLVAEAAGAKITVGRNWVFRDNLFEKNLATALWLDMSSYNATIVNNRVFNNLSYGIYYEISARAIIAANLVVGNSSGIRISNASDVKIYNNTLARNSDNIWIQDDERENTDASELQRGITHNTRNIEIRNNILSEGDSSQNPFIVVRDYNSKPRMAADGMISVCDSNAYYRRNQAVPKTLVSWWRGSQELRFADLSEFYRFTGQESHGVLIDDVPENPFFVAEHIRDYRLKPGSIAANKGEKLAAEIAEAMGIKAGTTIDLGVPFH